MRVKTFCLLVFFGLFFFPGLNYAQQEYGEKITPNGKIVFGLSQQEALDRYGVPNSISGKLWYYGKADKKVYVYLENPFGVYLYPRFCNGSVGLPLELRVLAGSQEITDVTSQAQLLLNNPHDFSILTPGVVVPKKPGKYQIIVLYKGVYSNASFISVTQSEEKSPDDLLLSLDIFPYKAYAGPKSKIDFHAFGTFVTKDGRYDLRNITDKVEWYLQQDNKNSKLLNAYVELSLPGKYKVFCKYRGRKSVLQDLEIAGNPVKSDHYLLRQISILPSYISVPEQAQIPFFVFATFADNRVEEMTKNVEWQVADKSILLKKSGNNFIANSVGITAIQASLPGVKSLPVKVAVSSADSFKGSSLSITDKKESTSELLKEIKNGLDDLKNKVGQEEKFKFIKIVPSSCDIRMGEEKQLLVFGVRQNNTEEEITILLKWVSLDKKIATVNNGLVQAVAVGQAKVGAWYKDLKSEYAKVTVKEAKLTAITLTPASLKIITAEQADLKADGLFSDSSHKDITLLASWTSDNADIAKVEKGRIKGFKPGAAKIKAAYLGVESVVAEIEVAKEKYWLLKLIVKIMLFILLLLLLLCVYFYLKIEQTKKRILKLYGLPNDFIVALYGNLSKIMIIFGAEYKFYMPPLLFAVLLDKKYAIGDALFFKFTQVFEEARYSNHLLPQEASRKALEDYNQILKLIWVKDSNTTKLFNYLKAFFSQTPLMIGNIYL